KVLIVTPGLNEVWYFRADGSVFSRSPWRMAPSLVEHRVLTVEENVRDLQRMLDVLRVYNRDLKLIVTLSPIALHATFLADRDHVITANAHSKAVLRVAIDEFVRRNKDVFYFPSFELISYCIKSPWHPDQRHVTEEAVSRVMHFFREMYCV
ncbi:MAG: GSCFA domain-containing protein, partial [Bdellovibrionota bacterium]